jgi:hypothetical protein
VLLSFVVKILPYSDCELFYFAGLATTFEEAWSALGNALEAAAQVLRGSPLIESSRNPSFINGDVTDITSDDEYREALKKDKVRNDWTWADSWMPVLVRLHNRVRRS